MAGSRGASCAVRCALICIWINTWRAAGTIYHSVRCRTLFPPFQWKFELTEQPIGRAPSTFGVVQFTLERELWDLLGNFRRETDRSNNSIVTGFLPPFDVRGIVWTVQLRTWYFRYDRMKVILDKLCKVIAQRRWKGIFRNRSHYIKISKDETEYGIDEPHIKRVHSHETVGSHDILHINGARLEFAVNYVDVWSNDLWSENIVCGPTLLYRMTDTGHPRRTMRKNSDRFVV